MCRRKLAQTECVRAQHESDQPIEHGAGLFLEASEITLAKGLLELPVDDLVAKQAHHFGGLAHAVFDQRVEIDIFEIGGRLIWLVPEVAECSDDPFLPFGILNETVKAFFDDVPDNKSIVLPPPGRHHRLLVVTRILYTCRYQGGIRRAGRP